MYGRAPVYSGFHPICPSVSGAAWKDGHPSQRRPPRDGVTYFRLYVCMAWLIITSTYKFTEKSHFLIKKQQKSLFGSKV